MSQTASVLVHHVILQVSLRERELSAPIPLRVLLATQPNVVTPALHATAPSRTTTSPLPTTPQRKVSANGRNSCAPLRDAVCAYCTAAMRSVASTRSWPSSAGHRTVPNGYSAAHRRRSRTQGRLWDVHRSLSIGLPLAVDDPDQKLVALKAKANCRHSHRRLPARPEPNPSGGSGVGQVMKATQPTESLRAFPPTDSPGTRLASLKA
jgi:hypothetical protein